MSKLYPTKSVLPAKSGCLKPANLILTDGIYLLVNRNNISVVITMIIYSVNKLPFWPM